MPLLAASYHNARLACDSEGHLTAAEWDSGVDHGAYALLADTVMMSFTRMAYHGYRIPNARALTRLVTTNHNQIVPYRGFGAPQIYTCTEAMMDMLAKKAGIDPLEFRYINAAVPGDLNVNSCPYREYPMKEIIDKGRPMYEEFKADAEAAKK